MARRELSKVYQPGPVEAYWYEHWEKSGYFRPQGDGAPYTVVIPPPNVTGILTIGHVLNNTIQDILVRRARMQGRRTLWLPGTDHASIATEAKVVRAIREEGLDKAKLGREKFLERAWEWAHTYGGTILTQLRKLGCSCDWERTIFTMDEGYSKAVVETFVRLYEDGLIYRGQRLINWDPQGQTALSDEEVIHKETQGNLWYFKYPLKDDNRHVVVATTRPETMLGDTGIAVNPNDGRYTELLGMSVILPLVDRELPIFADEFVDPEFGTGAVKVTPAHDPNDYDMGQRHGLEMVNIFHPDATLNDNAPEAFRGMDRFAARKAVVKAVEEGGYLDKVEAHTHNVGYSERTDAMVEPYLSEQWFVRMPDLARPAQEAVEDGRITLYPDRWVKVYRHWLSHIQDWCISRQLWWGHRIPAWYGPDGDIFVGRDEAEAQVKARARYGQDVSLSQDQDVLDTWFSSWLWPLATLGWPDSASEDLKTFYPTQDLVTGPDIIFFWVARMVMAGLRFRDDIPFSTVYFTGIVRDKQGRKVSKSLGNSPDPLDLIENYGADALRMGLMLIAPQGQDILFSEEDIVQGRNYMNKIWNAGRFLLMNLDETLPEPLETVSEARIDAADRWILTQLTATVEQVDKAYEKYRINEVAKSIYDFVWSDYCDWYLELIKARLTGDDPADRETAQVVAVNVFRHILKLIHPFAPFLSEELWQAFRREGDPDLMMAPHPSPESITANFPEEAREIGLLQGVVTALRSMRADMGIPPGATVDVLARGEEQEGMLLKRAEAYLKRLAKVGDFTFSPELKRPPHAATAVVGTLEIFLPLEGLINLDVERERLSKRIAEMTGRLTAVENKLKNDNFVSRAPEDVVAHERRKQADYSAQLTKLEANLAALS